MSQSVNAAATALTMGWGIARTPMLMRWEGPQWTKGCCTQYHEFLSLLVLNIFTAIAYMMTHRKPKVDSHLAAKTSRSLP